MRLRPPARLEADPHLVTLGETESIPSEWLKALGDSMGTAAVGIEDVEKNQECLGKPVDKVVYCHKKLRTTPFGCAVNRPRCLSSGGLFLTHSYTTDKV